MEVPKQPRTRTRTRTRDREIETLGRAFSGVSAEQALVFQHHVTVRHSGEIVAHGTMQSNLAGALAGLFANLTRMFQVKLKQFLEHPRRAPVRLVNDRVEVEIPVKIAPQFEIQLAPLVAALNERPRMEADFVGCLHARVANQPFAGLDD